MNVSNGTTPLRILPRPHSPTLVQKVLYIKGNHVLKILEKPRSVGFRMLLERGKLKSERESETR